MLRVDALCDIVHSTMGDREVPRTEEAGGCTSYAGRSELIVQLQCTEFFLYNTLPGSFGVWFLDKIYHPELAFSFLLWHGDLK